LEDRQCLTRDKQIPSGCHQDSPGVLIAAVEIAHMDRGVVTNSRGKQAAKRPNELLKGRLAYIPKAKTQNDHQGQPPTKHLQSTHVTRIREGDAFGDLHKIDRRISSLRLITRTSSARGYCWGCRPKALHQRSPSASTHALSSTWAREVTG
jgi:hypothetical protein